MAWIVVPVHSTVVAIVAGGHMHLHASAVLVWLPKGTKPDLHRLDLTQLNSPTTPNPEAFWLLRDAISRAIGMQDTAGNVPWIKTGDELLSPDAILAASGAPPK